MCVVAHHNWNSTKQLLLSVQGWIVKLQYQIHQFLTGKARRLKQAKEEAQDEIEKYRKERERQFREFEAKHMGSKEDVAAKIDADTKLRIAEMNRLVQGQKEAVSFCLFIYLQSCHVTGGGHGFHVDNL